MDEMNTGWLDEFDDSVLNDTIEANDSSALTGFENNTGAETETTSPLEADETSAVSEDVTQSSDDFFKYFTPTISRAAGPSSISNDASSKGDKPAKGSNSDPKDDDKDVDLNDYYGGGKTDGDDPNDQGGYGSNWDNDNDPDNDPDEDPDVDLDDYYGGGKTDGDDDDDDYGSWTDKDRLEAAKEIAEALGKEAEKAATESKLAHQAEKEIFENVKLKTDEVIKAQAECDKIQSQIDSATVGLNSGEGVGTEESKKAHEAMAEAATKYGKGSKEYKNAVIEAMEIDKKELERLQAIQQTAEEKLKTAQAAAAPVVSAYEKAINASLKAQAAAREALAKSQAAKDKVGTLAGEAKEAFERAQEKQKEWEEQKQKEATKEAGSAGIDGKSDSDNNASTGTNPATNNPVTFDLAKTLADSGAKMTEKEYGQVADFVAGHPELASIINGGLTNAEKHTIGNVIAGIQAINEGNYLTAAKELAQGLGMTLVSAVQLVASGIYGAGARILGIIKSFMENPNIKYGSHNKDFETFEKMRAEYGDSSELQALYDTAKGTTDQKQTFDYMKDNAATNVGEYNEGLVEDVNKVVSDASRKVIHYSPYVLEAVKKWR